MNPLHLLFDRKWGDEITQQDRNIRSVFYPPMDGCMDEAIHLLQENLWQEKTPIYLERTPKSRFYKILRNVYDQFLYPARNIYLADYLSKFVSQGESVLDIGCAEGTIPYIMSQKKNFTVYGSDVYFKSKPLYSIYTI
jgi:2-polyprenyl-3-methyl-5-hydroxy-6-metoxy-1,4-benzoquinol methylase